MTHAKMYESDMRLRVAFECNAAHAILQLIIISKLHIRRRNSKNRKLPISPLTQNWWRK